jgi:glutathione S-transferase
MTGSQVTSARMTGTQMTGLQSDEPLPVLYSFRRCPYAMRARMALGIAGIACELREVVLRDRPPEMLALSAKGTVPVLHLPDGRVIDESLDVMHWALAHHDPLGWLGATNPHGWVTLFDGEFKHHLDRYKYASRYDGAEATTHREAARGLLAQVEPHLESGWIGRAHPGFADIAVLPFVRQYRIADPVWFDTELGLPHVQKWLAAFLDLPLFNSVMEKYERWTSDHAGVIFAPTLSGADKRIQ